jgi:hypothetical protein
MARGSAEGLNGPSDDKTFGANSVGFTRFFRDVSPWRRRGRDGASPPFVLGDFLAERSSIDSRPVDLGSHAGHSPLDRMTRRAEGTLDFLLSSLELVPRVGAETMQ